MPAETATIFVSTGELSGDMHAASAISALNTLRAECGLAPVSVTANGSTRLQAAGASILHDVATWSEIGLIPTLLKAPHFLRALRDTLNHILKTQPQMVLLVDSRVMNLRLAQALRRKGYTGRIVYYVAPVRWESLYDSTEHGRSLRNSRFLEQKQYCDLSIPIYPVSLDVYAELGIPHVFPGHPLCELARPRLSHAQFSNLTGIAYDPDHPPLLVGALTGSRLGEIRSIAPPVFEALALIQQALMGATHLPPLHFVATAAHRSLRPALLSAARQAGLDGLQLLDPDYTYDLMARSRLVIAKSGTGLHECMLLGVPALMCYRVTPSVAWIARHIMRFKMPFYGFPNLLAGKAVVPELIQEECRATRIAAAAGELLFGAEARAVMQSEFAALRTAVCRPDVMHTVASALQAQLEAGQAVAVPAEDG